MIMAFMDHWVNILQYDVPPQQGQVLVTPPLIRKDFCHYFYTAWLDCLQAICGARKGI